MGLTSGTRLGPYEILSALGAGGMGEVYRARDTKLDREVAVKVLPDLFALDAQRLDRFRREALVLASLNHPNIAAIYGLEDTDGHAALVLEMVDGPTLADRLARGRLPLAEALAIASQIADALEAAHDQGIIHRDLKPANIKVRPDGTVKVLDFGLARMAEAQTDGLGSTLAAPAALTMEGAILGTPAYMSPEQATGGSVDERADIWAFGVLLYEALAGRPAFAADSASATIARLLERQPEWDALSPEIPRGIRRLLRRCLEKDPRRRLRHMGDARLELNDATSAPEADAAPQSRTSQRLRALAWGTALCLAGFLVGVAVTRPWRALPSSALAHLEISVPRGQSLMFLANPVAISPDGRHVAFATHRQLYLRAIDHLTAAPVSGAENARSPFFSPDGQWIAFWTSGEIRKASIHGGVPITICRARNLYGATWSEDGRILYGQGPLGIYEVSADGGEPKALLRPDPAKGELGFQSPQLLPGASAMLFTQLDVGKNWNSARVMVQLLDRNERRAILDGGSDARYLPSGHLVFTRERALHAVAFDPDALRLRGSPVPVIDNVRRAQLWETGATQFGVSSSGTLVYVPAGADWGRKIVWVDRHGVEEELPMPIRFYVHPRLSPDGRRIVVDTVDTLDVWIYDLHRGTLRRLTAEQTNLHPVWSADGRRVIYDSTQGAGLHWTEVDGAATELIVRDPSHLLTAVSVTRDGKYLAFERSEDWVSYDIAVLQLSGNREPRPFLATRFKEMSPVFSPDGQWLAYVSDETGTEEVYVQPYPGPGAKTLISTGGGREPQWSPAGGELFYRARNALMAVRVATQPVFSASRPQQLFERAYAAEPIGSHPTYDVSSDGQRFLFVKDVVRGETPNRLHVVFGWFDDIRRQAVVSK